MSTQNSKIFTYLGFASKARTVKAGEQTVLAFLKKNKVYLLIISETASENAIRRWKIVAEQFQVPYIVFGSQEDLGLAIGSSYKTILALTDEKLAKHIQMIAE